MIVDAHHHFWNPARGDYGWMSGAGLEHLRRPILPKDFAPHLKAQGIDKTVLVQAAPTVAETEYLLGIADTTDHVAKVVGWVNFENRADVKHLERLVKHPKFAGVRPMIQDLPDPEWMHRTDVQWAFDAMIDLDLTFDALGFPQHLEHFLRLFQRYPTLRCVVDHGMKPRIRNGEFESWAKGMTLIARETKAYCKVSGLATEASVGWRTETLLPYIRHIIDVFGPARVMFGSDWPVLELNGTFDTWLATAHKAIQPSEEKAIFGETARQFYRFK
ncbi:MAG: amidohydrolase family protein [Alphaproteobacteria bacterium]|nr:amidohydrolase family protein [Alphaproteobacteria bacterium]